MSHHDIDANRKRTYFLTRLIFDTPLLTSRYHQEQSRWEDPFVNTLLRARAPGREELFALRVQVAIKENSLLRPWVNAAFQTLNGAAAIAALPSVEKKRRR